MGRQVMSAAHTLLGRGDAGIPQQIGIDRVLRRPSAGAGPPAEARNPMPPISRCTRFRHARIPAAPATPSSVSDSRRAFPGTPGRQRTHPACLFLAGVIGHRR